MSAKKATQKSAKSTSATNKKSKGFTNEERAAMKERAEELKKEAAAARRRQGGRGRRRAREDRRDAGTDRAMAKRLHVIVKATAAILSPKPWYGMPAYAMDGKVASASKRAEVQREVRDGRLQRHGEPRRRRHVAGRLLALSELLPPKRQGSARS